jgi:hypothetical protein
MKINIEKSEDHYRADCKDLPGSPPVGLGETPEMAIACLFWRLIFEDTAGTNPKSWLSFIKRAEPIVVNDVVWNWPNSYRKNG